MIHRLWDFLRFRPDPFVQRMVDFHREFPMSKDPIVQRSKHLSLVLRHDPASAGLVLDEAGWVDVAKLLPAVRLSQAQLDEVVLKNDKKRFEFNADRTRIRACQGHTVEVDLGLEEKIPPDTLFHGTSTDFVPDILREGLKPMKRQDVHLSADQNTAWIVARRRPRPTILEVFAGPMHAAGYKFYLSTNGVWLTDEVPARFLSPLAKM